MNHSVLVVDDESTIREMLRDVLSREPYDVFIAGSAAEGLEILDREHVDVVISDEKMPGMLGSEFLAIVRQKYPDTIRMILTGYASLEAAIRSINEGEIYRFFTKPCNVFDLAVTVRQALQHKELMKEAQKMLKVLKQQSTLIEDLEKRYPGITEVKRNKEGEVILEDIDPEKWEALLE